MFERFEFSKYDQKFRESEKQLQIERILYIFIWLEWFCAQNICNATIRMYTKHVVLTELLS